MPTNTSNGHVQISTLQDLIDALARHKSVTTIRYAPLQPYAKVGLVYAALWSADEQRGYGGCVLSYTDFRTLRSWLGKFKFENTGTPDPEID